MSAGEHGRGKPPFLRIASSQEALRNHADAGVQQPYRAAARGSCLRNPGNSIARLASFSCLLSSLPSLLVQGVDAEG